ncbi:hypothetical protein WJX73_007082 [Symbiochloris irregularis]|uniref:Tyr recombinase domain-containing protein n=1 Tax=Symbiochloris irregularis TaxID=706552 RepID=A0AAW1P2L3_9CHLO
MLREPLTLLQVPEAGRTVGRYLVFQEVHTQLLGKTRDERPLRQRVKKGLKQVDKDTRSVDPTASGLFAESIPDELFEEGFPTIPLGGFRGLHKASPRKFREAVLQDQLRRFEGWCGLGVKISRQGERITENTYKTVYLTLMQFLEFLTYSQLNAPNPDLSHVPNADLVMSYFSCRAKAGASGKTMAKDSSTLLLPRIQAREVHDAVMACFLFAYIGPQRGIDVRSLIGPDNDKPCQFKTCLDARGECYGNSIQRVTDVGEDDAFVMYISHHKNVKSVGVRSIILPPDLTALLELYQCKAYPVLKAWALSKGKDHPYLLMTGGTGVPFDQSSFSRYWRVLMKKWGGPVEGPHYLRHLFVDERCSHDAVAGPAELGAATAMGNSLHTWKHHYRKKLDVCACQAFVDDQKNWRAQLEAKRLASQTASVAVKAEFVESAEASVIDLDADSSEAEDDIVVDLCCSEDEF